MLIKSLQVSQKMDEAGAYQNWIDAEFPVELHVEDEPSYQPLPKATVSADDNLTGPYMWSKEQGFDVRSPYFGFDVCNPRIGNGKAPIHQAIEHENLEQLQSMLQNIVHIEQRDSTGATPIHLAAATLNKRVCAMLLEKGANVDVLDHKHSTPLHKCQSKSQGVQVATLLLDRSPELIDRVDCFGKTALYMACEKGNEPSEYSSFDVFRANRTLRTEALSKQRAMSCMQKSSCPFSLILQ
jgi:ankyrin repeat protein